MVGVLGPRTSVVVLLLSIGATAVGGCAGGKRVAGPPKDTTPPAVTGTIPAPGASGIALNASLTATFSESMDAGNHSVAGRVTCVAATATFTPGADLDGTTAYVATLGTGVSDVAGNHTAQSYSWGFTTAAAPDTAAPQVLATDPADGAIDVSPTAPIAVTFSEAMNPSLINATTLFLKNDQGTTVSGGVSYDAMAKTATLTPSATLSHAKTYTATMSRDATDLAGNLMWHDRVWSFTTNSAQASFTIGTRIPGGGWVSGDVNNDGALDLLGSDRGGSVPQALVWLGDGAGLFGPMASFPVGPYPGVLTSSDVNGDGKIDLLVVHGALGYPPPAGTVGVLPGDGAGSFGAESSFVVGQSPRDVAARDFTGDRRVDLVVSNRGSGDLSLLIGDGSGGFAPHQDIPLGMFPGQIVVADYDENGSPDLAVVGDAGVAVLINDGTGSFTITQYAVGPYPEYIATGDVNGDGNLDLVISNDSTDHLSTLMGNGSGSFHTGDEVVVGRYPQLVVCADLNGDGVQDLVVATGTNGGVGTNAVHVIIGQGGGAFGASTEVYQVSGLGILTPAMSVGDFNGDRRPDLAVGDPGSGQAVILLNTSPQAFSVARRFKRERWLSPRVAR